MKRRNFLTAMTGALTFPLWNNKIQKERTLSCTTDRGIVDEHGRVVSKNALHIYDAEGNCFDDVDMVLTDINLDTGAAKCFVTADDGAPLLNDVTAQDAFLKTYLKNIHIIERSTYFKIKLKETIKFKSGSMNLFEATIYLKAPLTYKVEHET